VYDRFQAIVNSHLARAFGAPALRYDAMVTIKGFPLTVLKVMSVINSSNFINDICTITHITLAVPTSQMRLLTTAANGNMKVKIMTRNGSTLLNTMNYNGVVVNSRDPDMESSTMFTAESNDKAMAVVQLELMDASVWYQRLKQVGDIYRGTDCLTIIRDLLTATTERGDKPVGTVHSVQYDREEQRKYECISIPDSVDFLEAFDFLQNRYGVYERGLGVFQYFNNWHIFRPWDVDKFANAPAKLVVMNLPKERAAHLDKSVHIDGNVIYIITGGDTLSMLQQDTAALNDGTGYRVGSIRALDGRTSSFTPGELSSTTPDKFVAQAAPNTHASGMVNAPVQKKHYTDDDKAIKSELAMRTGNTLKVTWNGALPGILAPGMGVKFMYANDVGIYTRYGTLAAEVFQAATDGQTMGTSQYNTVAELTLWLSTTKVTS